MPRIRKRSKAKRELMPHQCAALAFAETKNHVALFMEMRLGKTLVAIRYLASKYYVRYALVVAPVTVLEAWERELSLEGETFLNLSGKSKPARMAILDSLATRPSGRTWLLINYEGLLATPVMAKAPWDAVVLDESTRIKSPDAKTTKLCIKGFRQVKHRLILTGLPNPENEFELFCQLQFLWGSFAGCVSYWGFRSKYGTYNEREMKWTMHPQWRGPIKDLIQRRAFILSREKARMGKRKIYQIRNVPSTPEQMQLYRKAEADFEILLSDGTMKETQYTIVVHNWLCKIAGGFTPDEVPELISNRKTEELLELLQGELWNQKAVVWFKYRHEVEHVANHLRLAQIPFVQILGGDPLEERKARLDAFRHDARVLLATEKVAKFGIDCSVASTAIYYSNEWSCEDRVQSEDRILHPQKDEPLLYIDLCTEGTVDHRVAEAVQEKSLNAKLFLKNIQEFIRRAKERSHAR